METARLRAAYGESGEPPRAGESLVHWQASSLADENALGFIIQNQGNPKIGPEITKEYEVGLDGSFLMGRVNYTTTAYKRETEDRLISIWPSSSEGLEEQYTRNLGNWSAKGIEAALDVLVFDGLDWQFSVNGRYQWNDTRMGKLSNNPNDDFGLTWSEYRYSPGRVMPVFMDQRLLNGNELGVMPLYSDTAEVYGPSNPPHEASAGFTFNAWNRLTLDAFFLAQWGHWMTDLRVRTWSRADPAGRPSNAWTSWQQFLTTTAAPTLMP